MLANQRSDVVRYQDLEAAKSYKGRGGSPQWKIDLSLFLNLHHEARGARRKGKGAGDLLGTGCHQVCECNFIDPPTLLQCLGPMMNPFEPATMCCNFGQFWLILVVRSTAGYEAEVDRH